MTGVARPSRDAHAPTLSPAGLNDRSLGWLRFMWDKATTDDDWSDQGEPHPWWDRYSEPPMCAFPRFDLAEMGYVLPMMVEATPAWRDVYTRILDELVRRYVSFWGGIDWNTLVGPDPNVDKYPPEWLTVLPERLRGRYAPPGWTANGVEPWGLQPDPIGCDGNLFYRGWLNLLLTMRHYISGQPAQDRPFEVSGYQNRRFTWTHQRVAQFIADQMKARPQGVHCENTKIWPFCMSAAGLGLKLYDQLMHTAFNEPFLDWIAFAKKHYIGRDRRGRINWVAFYHDPIENTTMTFPGPLNGYGALVPLHYIYPQDPQFGIDLYDSAMHRLGWSNPKVPVVQFVDDPKMLATALWMARELGDSTTLERLHEVAEREFEPRYFGEDKSRFAFWFGRDEPWPRGQDNATMMMAECADPGAWSRVFNSPNTAMHHEPTVRGLDYPSIGIRRTHNDIAGRTLEIETFAATPSRRGTPTSFTVDNLPHNAAISVNVDDHPCVTWRRSQPGAVAIDVDIDTHRIDLAYS